MSAGGRKITPEAIFDAGVGDCKLGLKLSLTAMNVLSAAALFVFQFYRGAPLPNFWR